MSDTTRPENMELTFSKGAESCCIVLRWHLLTCSLPWKVFASICSWRAVTAASRWIAESQQSNWVIILKCANQQQRLMEMKVIVLLLRALSAKVEIKTFYVDCCDMCVSLCVCVCFFIYSLRRVKTMWVCLCFPSSTITLTRLEMNKCSWMKRLRFIERRLLILAAAPNTIWTRRNRISGASWAWEGRRRFVNFFFSPHNFARICMLDRFREVKQCQRKSGWWTILSHPGRCNSVS